MEMDMKIHMKLFETKREETWNTPETPTLRKMKMKTSPMET